MGQFLACLCDKNYSVLGPYSETELYDAWITLIGQYYELRGDSVESIPEWRTSRDITRLRNHLYLVEQCVDFLNKRYSDSIADSLRKLGYVFNPVVKEPDQYRNMLQAVINASKTKFIKLQGLLKEAAKKLDTQEKVVDSRQGFENTLLHIEEMQKVSYDFDDLTVYKFVMLEKKLLHKIEALNKN